MANEGHTTFRYGREESKGLKGGKLGQRAATDATMYSQFTAKSASEDTRRRGWGDTHRGREL